MKGRARFSSLIERVESRISYQNQEVREGKTCYEVDMVINLLLSMLCLECYETSMQVLNRPLSI